MKERNEVQKKRSIGVISTKAAHKSRRDISDQSLPPLLMNPTMVEKYLSKLFA